MKSCLTVTDNATFTLFPAVTAARNAAPRGVLVIFVFICSVKLCYIFSRSVKVSMTEA